MTGAPRPAGLVTAWRRCFWSQSLWTRLHMQGFSWSWGLLPVLKRLHPDPDQLSQALREHGGYFSTHPDMVPVIQGVVIGMEERLKGAGGGRESVLAARQGMAGPLAAIGEGLFWNVWRGLTLGAAWLAAVLFRRGPLAAAAIFILLYNGGTFAWRFWSSGAGYDAQLELPARLARWNLRVWTDRGNAFLAVATLAPLCLLFVGLPGRSGFFLLAAAAGAVVRRSSGSALARFYILVVSALAMSFVWWARRHA